MADFIGKGYIHGLNEVVGTHGEFDIINPVTGSGTYSGYVKSPEISDLTLGYNSRTAEQLMDQDGEIGALMAAGEFLQCTFNLRGKGATKAAAQDALTLPKFPFGVVITGLRIIQLGSFTDALNVNTGGAGTETCRWYMLSDVNISGRIDGPWGAAWTMFRFPKMTGAPVHIAAV